MSTGRNFAVNLGGNLLGLVLFAALTPVYLHAIGPERYGVVAVILSLSTYVATFNFGMGPALTYFVSGELRDDVAAQSEAYWSAMALSAPIGLIASIIIFGLLPLGLAELMHLSPAIRVEMRGAVVPLIGIGLCIVLASNARGVWNGRHAFLTLAVFSSLDTVLTILLPVLAAIFVSNEISALLYATLAARAVILLSAMAISSLRMFEHRLPRVSLRRVRMMLGYGGWVSLGTLVETIVSSADRLVLGTVSGASQIALYNIPLSVTSRSMTIPLSLLSVIFPKLVGADGERERVLLSKTIRFVLLLTPGYVLVAAVSAPLLRYWISPSFADSATWSLQILTLALWIEAISAIYFFLLNARGNARANFLIVLMVSAPYIAMLAVGAWLFGAAGVATAYLLKNILLFTGRGTFAQIRRDDLRAITINVAPLLLCVLVAPHGWGGITAFSVAVAVIAALLSLIACLWTRPHDLKDMALGMIPGRFQRNPDTSL
ncbi:oligosaccharide flippase family protein [Sphingomonas sp. MMS24-J45]|uniref:oligosaccharide flippase family protein n=1 Tax=Sphingomonas sp. MMS24-J45 TaxID=3238806 RepID=UPI00384F76C1